MDDLKRLEEIEGLSGAADKLSPWWQENVDWLIARLRAALTLPEDAEKVVEDVLAYFAYNAPKEAKDALIPAPIKRCLSLLAPALARVKELERCARCGNPKDEHGARQAFTCEGYQTWQQRAESHAELFVKSEARVAELEAENEKLRNPKFVMSPDIIGVRQRVACASHGIFDCAACKIFAEQAALKRQGEVSK